jgi:hypothetical protein
MDVESQNQQQEKKEERIDELDIIGGSIFKLVGELFSKITALFIPRKVE